MVLCYFCLLINKCKRKYNTLFSNFQAQHSLLGLNEMIQSVFVVVEFCSSVVYVKEVSNQCGGALVRSHTTICPPCYSIKVKSSWNLWCLISVVVWTVNQRANGTISGLTCTAKPLLLCVAAHTCGRDITHESISCWIKQQTTLTEYKLHIYMPSLFYSEGAIFFFSVESHSPLALWYCSAPQREPAITSPPPPCDLNAALQFPAECCCSCGCSLIPVFSAFFSGICILVIHFLLALKFHYLPESIAVIMIGKLRYLSNWISNVKVVKCAAYEPANDQCTEEKERITSSVFVS